MTRIVLAYSGGLETSVAVPWLKERYEAEVVAVTLDIGQGGELNQIRERAISAGASRCHVLDVRDEFARDYVLPALQGGALYEERHPLATALSRPLIAKKLVDIARMENAGSVAHGCTANGNDQVRIDSAVRALNPALRVIAPASESGMSRAEVIAYARARRVSVPVTTDDQYSTDRNLWGRSVAYGAVADSWNEAPEDIYTLTKSPADTPHAPAYVDLHFRDGVPTVINGVEMSLVELINSLETIAGVHGVGRLDMVEDNSAGIKSRTIHEAPAALLLHEAHRDLEALVIPKDLQRLKRSLSKEYADLIYDGLWFSPTRSAIDAFVQHMQARVTGDIRLKLFKAHYSVVGRRTTADHSDHHAEQAGARPAAPAAK